MNWTASSRDFKKTCSSAILDTLFIDCTAWIKDITIEVSVECPDGRVSIKTREFSVESDAPGETFFKPSIEDPLIGKPIVERLRNALNKKRLSDRKKALERLASDILASVLTLCE